MTPPITFIVGCTGCGKGGVARELARRVGAEIVSLDSMKVYRRMDIGTAKPSPEVRREIPHHLIDVVEPSESFSVAQFVELARRAIDAIAARQKPIIVVGGTFLYLKALTEGLFDGPGADPAVRDRLRRQAESDGGVALHERLRVVDPASADRIHVNDLRRIVRALEVYELTGQPISTLQAQWDRAETASDDVFIGLRRTREDQSARTNRRVHRMIDQGLVEEVRSLLAEPAPLSPTARKAVGYAEIAEYLQNRSTLADAIESIKINTRQLAKAQRTWLKRFGSIRWFDLATETAEQAADQLISEGAWSRPASPK